MTISVNLQIVGLYFSEKITITAEEPRVLDALNAASSAGLIDFQLDNEGSLNIVQRHIKQTVVNTKGGKPRSPGFYAIEELRTDARELPPTASVDEEFVPARVQAWQYYIERPSTADPIGPRTLISRTKPGDRFRLPAFS